jgi:serine/threonine-protein kinase HipA
MTNELIALLAGKEVGRVRRTANGRLSFVYDDGWRSAPNAFPLSLSMPVAASEHGAAFVEAFLWGLLPDNEFVLDRWARKFQVSARNVFALLSNVGEDCAGAVQFVVPDRLDAVRSGDEDKVDWLDEHDVAERLRTLREDHSAWRLPRDKGQFSLAGAQPKTALLFKDARWGVPSGRIPTTHILKPPTGQFDGHAENEHICLALARSVGLPAARSQVLRFEDEIAIAVERYDRVQVGNQIVRVHQEDVCQALGVSPTQKYQNEKGPSPETIIALLRTQSSDRSTDVSTFVDALMFNWLVAGTDAHAKNYSLLLAAGPRVRLAPLYDIASILPYDNFDRHKLKLAMKIGGEYHLNQIGPRQWLKFAQSIRVDGETLLARLDEMAGKIPDGLSDAKKKVAKEGLKNKIIDRLVAQVTARANSCLKALRPAAKG